MNMRVTIKSHFHNRQTWIQEDARPGEAPADVYLRLQYRAGEGDPSARRKLARIRRKLCGNRDCQCSFSFS